MALPAGFLAVSIDYAKDLKDKDLFGKMDPYCKVKAEHTTFKTKTHKRGGKNPVWSETFNFSLVNGNSVELELYDEDLVTDDFIGRAIISLARVRENGSDSVHAPVISKSGKQHGFVSVRLVFTPSDKKSGSAQPAPQTMHPTSMPDTCGAAAAAAAAAAGVPATGYPAYPAPQGAPPPSYPPHGYASAAGQAPHGYQPASASSAAPGPGGYPPPSSAGAASAYPPPSGGSSSGYPPPPSGGSAPGYPPQGSGYPPQGAPPPYGYPPQGGPHSYSHPHPHPHPHSYSAGGPPSHQQQQLGPPPPGYPMASGHSAPPAPGYGAPGYGAPPPGYGAPPPGYGYGGPRPTGGMGGHHKPHKPHKHGAGAGMGIGLGLLGGLAAGMLIGDMMD